jgi:translation initiation factor IF-3
MGKQINVMLTPLPVNKRKPKLHVHGQDEDIPDAPSSDDDEQD